MHDVHGEINAGPGEYAKIWPGCLRYYCCLYGYLNKYYRIMGFKRPL